MKIQALNVRPGNVIEHDGKQWTVLKIQILQPGKGGAFVQVEMRDVKSGNKSNERFRTQETIEKLMVDEKEATFLYAEGDNMTLMDGESYEQFEVSKEMVGEPARFLQDGMAITVDLIDGAPVAARLPQHVVMAVTEADPVVKGQTAASSYKPAVMENGVRVMVPPFIQSGERILVDTNEITYIRRAD